jgi:RNA polymerase sigma factor (sigma-70 family)
MDELFKGGSGRVSLPLLEERALIVAAQAGDGEAVWALLVQYRGILQKTANSARASVRGMTAEQVEDLQADLVLAAVEAVKSFDLEKYTRLSQVLPSILRGVATEMATALAVPSGTLDRWFKVWRAADQDYVRAAELAPTMGMTANTFRAIQHALAHAGSEWVSVPYSAGVPTPDDETYRLAHHALSVLSPAERDVIELAYGFRGEAKSDEEVAGVLEQDRGAVKKRRQRSLEKMRAELVED